MCVVLECAVACVLSMISYIIHIISTAINRVSLSSALSAIVIICHPLYAYLVTRQSTQL